MSATDKLELLQRESVLIQRRLLDQFPGPCERSVTVEPVNGDYLLIRNFPLPNRYRPDHIHLLLLTADYPAQPPQGFHLPSGHPALKAIRRHLHAYEAGAASAGGWSWLCWHYAGHSWRLDARRLMDGDCLYKFVESIFAVLNEAKPYP
jgi:hypothetical protein